MGKGLNVAGAFLRKTQARSYRSCVLSDDRALNRNEQLIHRVEINHASPKMMVRRSKGCPKGVESQRGVMQIIASGLAKEISSNSLKRSLPREAGQTQPAPPSQLCQNVTAHILARDSKHCQPESLG